MIVVAPNAQREGEQRADVLSQSAGQKTIGQLGEKCEDDVPKGNGQSSTDPQPEGGRDSNSLRRNRDEEGEPMDAPRKTRGIKRDYRRMNDPYSDEEDLFYVAQVEAILGGDDPKSLKQAKASLEWPEWECAIKSELDQLRDKGTWILVSTPKDAVPLSNKWVFAKKYGKGGELLKYKGRLVVKGYAQRPGFDYVETFSPVMRMETRAILALSALKRLAIGQDVKGAYLNGTLKEEYTCANPRSMRMGPTDRAY